MALSSCDCQSHTSTRFGRSVQLKFRDSVGRTRHWSYAGFRNCGFDFVLIKTALWVFFQVVNKFPCFSFLFENSSIGTKCPVLRADCLCTSTSIRMSANFSLSLTRQSSRPSCFSSVCNRKQPKQTERIIQQWHKFVV